MNLKVFKYFVIFLLIVSFSWISTTFADQYKIDPGHSSVGFQIRHIISKVNGQFNEFSGSFEFDEAKKMGGNLKVSIVAKSINTNNEKRDNHLRTADFFDVEKFPEIKFTSTKVEPVGGNNYKMQGYLTIHGVTKLVILDMEYLGSAKDPWGNDKIAFSATTKINRKDYGLVWNKTLETGGVLVGEEVTINLEVEADKIAQK